ncbi:cupin domain-containing protein [Nonomuraea turcica]|uniref:cupin domain-containing protein n=1 Tax=Nonomuraea sp. G32 TaxID=3067274 RepID=UPI00273CEF02|nr:cupin domain-containing protein [Nonomuraea sp. G32]MDP4511047.1 cupin domain-containing protein [Nonomuraea sp. G32]
MDPDLSTRELIMSSFADALVLEPHDAEYVALPGGGGFQLLADASDAGGALAANRLSLGKGANGAAPHHHELSTELFYVLDGTVEFLLDDQVITVGPGGLVVIPPRMPHAFGATPATTASLVVLTPGIDRFGYFRALGRIQHGLEPFDSLLPLQERYDVHFLDAPAWAAARSDHGKRS